MLDLIRTENKVLNKVLSVFVTLCRELELLKQEAEREIYGPLLIYGEGAGETADEGDFQVQFGAMLPFLQVWWQRVKKSVWTCVNHFSVPISPAAPLGLCGPREPGHQECGAAVRNAVFAQDAVVAGH